MWTDILSPQRRIPQEETLLIREAIDRGRSLFALQAIQISLVSDQQTSVVGDILTQRKTSVGMKRIYYDNLVILINQFISTLLETNSILGSPPIDQITILIVVTSLIIESMRHLMADYHTDSAIVHRIVGIRIKEWRLKDRGRETDLIRSRIVISVHGLRIHMPTRLIDRLIHVRQLIGHIEDVRTANIRPIRIVLDLQATIITPFVRITYFHRKSGQFLLRFRLSRIAHPFQAVDPLAQSSLQIPHQR